jgi:hypothetical protein
LRVKRLQRWHVEVRGAAKEVVVVHPCHSVGEAGAGEALEMNPGTRPPIGPPNAREGGPVSACNEAVAAVQEKAGARDEPAPAFGGCPVLWRVSPYRARARSHMGNDPQPFKRQSPNGSRTVSASHLGSRNTLVDIVDRRRCRMRMTSMGCRGFCQHCHTRACEKADAILGHFPCFLVLLARARVTLLTETNLRQMRVQDIGLYRPRPAGN